ncbi:hypothetical protein MKX03_032571 [Papaver bracteatum]|nr:hypothetical protein MKX03_032571 [Papaver bracteatum]
MTITLDDISNITGLKINGSAVQAKGPRELGFLEASSLVSKYLNIDEDKVKEEFASNNKQTLSLSWLKNGWMHIDDSDSNQDKEAASRAYILHLIGSVLCPDKTINAIEAYWIQSLKDITNFESVSLGSAILSYLFHQLGSASRHGTSSLSGCITLLQVWIYEHFPSLGRKIANENYEESLPRVCKWIPQVPQPSSVVTIRELLDDLAPQDVLWTPYENRIMYAPLENVIWYTGTMVCFDVAEPIYPERVLRQFGRVQRKPQRPLQTETTRRGDKASTYRVEYSKSIWHWEQWRNALLSEELRSIPVDNDIPWASDDGYMEWFNTVSHPIVQNPTRRLHQSLSQRLNPSQPATGKFAQRIKQIIEIALCRNIDVAVRNMQV